MKMNAPVLSQDETLKIHKESIRVLEEVGIKFPSEKALGLIEEAGGKVDWDNQIAYINEAMVADALEKAPKNFVLGGRNPEFDLYLPSDFPVLNMDGCGSYTIDFESGKRRTAVAQDLVNAAKVFEAIPSASILWSCISPSDIGGGANGIVSSAISMMNCSKHLQDEIQRVEEIKYIVEICKAILGSEEAVRERKIYSVTYCTVAPLCHDKDMLEATMELGKYDVPVMPYPMPSSGSTGPASLFSNIVVGNVEALSTYVILQLANPGTPMVYGAALGRINIKTGMFLEGAVETELMLTGMAQMGKHYGLPVEMAGCLSDANMLGSQSVMEKTLTTMPLVLNDVDVIQGIGLIEGSMSLSLEHMIVDEEIFKQCMRMKEGIDTSREKNLFDDISKVAHGGHYLKQPSTRKAFRTDEFYNSKLIRSDSYDTWVGLGSPTIFDEAHKKVDEILKSEPPNPLDKDTIKVIDEIIEEAKRSL